MFWLPLPLHLYLYLKTIWISISWSRKKRKCWRVYLKKMPFFFAFVSLKCSHFLWSDGASFQSSHDSFIWTIITKVTISKNSANKKYKNKNSMNIEHTYRRTLTYAQTSKWNLGHTTDFSHHDSNIDSYVYSTIRKL